MVIRSPSRPVLVFVYTSPRLLCPLSAILELESVGNMSNIAIVLEIAEPPIPDKRLYLYETQLINFRLISAKQLSTQFLRVEWCYITRQFRLKRFDTRRREPLSARAREIFHGYRTYRPKFGTNPGRKATREARDDGG